MNIRSFLQRWSPLFLISGLGLFLELSVIRWLSAEVRLFSYYKNLPLLAAFLGLAIGYSMAKKQRGYLPSFAMLLAIYVALVLVISNFVSPYYLAYPSTNSEFLWYVGGFSYWVSLAVFLGLVSVFFIMTMLLFIPLGQSAGEEMSHHPPVQAYIVNIIASLFGVWLFTALSYFQTPPFVWMGVSLVGIGYYLLSKQLLTKTTLSLFGLILLSLLLEGNNIFWSPYSRLDLSDLTYVQKSDGQPVRVGYNVQVQQVFYQAALNLSPTFLKQLNGEFPTMDATAYSYNLPYRLARHTDRVLIVGAGTGNDVAAALRNGAGYVDAVEIDPAILDIGKRLHPEQPYSDPRVHAVVDDARSFFEKTSVQYDVIAFGLLDSHSLLSGMSNVRLDSFVYTVESFQQVRAHLKPDGLVSVSFAVGQDWIDERLGRILATVFGPDHIIVYKGDWGNTYLAGFTTPVSTDLGVTAWHSNPLLRDIPLSTDDWPFLYLRQRVLPDAYWQALFVIGCLCFFIIARSFPEALKPKWHFWFLGAAFLLLECKSITELALLFGTTWIVNSLAITGVLLMSLLANLIVLRRQKINIPLAYLMLFASLALSYIFPLEWLNGFEPISRAWMSMVLLSLPLFFAGLIFGASLETAGELAGPLASNLSGSFVGGILEYGSLIWGIKSLYVIAAMMYGGAFAASRLQKGK